MRKLHGNARPPNDYRVEGKVAYIKLRSSVGEYGAKIDAADVERVVGGGTWNLQRTKKYYYATMYPRGGSQNRNLKIYLHRFLTGAPKNRGVMVDHINGNTLDCRRANLRVVAHAENRRNTWYRRVLECSTCQLCLDHDTPYLR